MKEIWITGLMAGTSTVSVLKKTVGSARAMAMFLPDTPYAKADPHRI